MMKRLLITLTIAVMSVPAMAQLVIAPGISYGETTAEFTTPAPGGEQTVGEMRIDGKIGYILPMGLYLGGMYANISKKFTNSSNSGTLMGPTVGYYSMMGFHTLFTYHIMGQLDASSTSEYTGGKGPQIDVGWVFPLTSYFSIGPQMTWRSIEFDKIETAGVSVDTDYKETSIVPYLSLWFMF